jgi:hypothetical protein
MQDETDEQMRKRINQSINQLQNIIGFVHGCLLLPFSFVNVINSRFVRCNLQLFSLCSLASSLGNFIPISIPCSKASCIAPSFSFHYKFPHDFRPLSSAKRPPQCHSSLLHKHTISQIDMEKDMISKGLGGGTKKDSSITE